MARKKHGKAWYDDGVLEHRDIGRGTRHRET